MSGKKYNMLPNSLVIEEYLAAFIKRLDDQRLPDSERDEIMYKIASLKIAAGTFMVLSEIKDILQEAEVEALSQEDIQ